MLNFYSPDGVLQRTKKKFATRKIFSHPPRELSLNPFGQHCVTETPWTDAAESINILCHRLEKFFFLAGPCYHLETAFHKKNPWDSISFNVLKLEGILLKEFKHSSTWHEIPPGKSLKDWKNFWLTFQDFMLQDSSRVLNLQEKVWAQKSNESISTAGHEQNAKLFPFPVKLCFIQWLSLGRVKVDVAWRTLIGLYYGESGKVFLTFWVDSVAVKSSSRQ